MGGLPALAPEKGPNHDRDDHFSRGGGAQSILGLADRQSR